MQMRFHFQHFYLSPCFLFSLCFPLNPNTAALLSTQFTPSTTLIEKPMTYLYSSSHDLLTESVRFLFRATSPLIFVSPYPTIATRNGKKKCFSCSSHYSQVCNRLYATFAVDNEAELLKKITSIISRVIMEEHMKMMLYYSEANGLNVIRRVVTQFWYKCLK